ncbi:MAG: HPr family phosphocarrier protein [Gammaproteobacteria bacterium]|nr:HPr family phosphocarrier protein [Gammaproteobacteria bacterium]
MIVKALPIINKLGLHARAAAKLVNTASLYKCHVGISKDEQSINGKSIMGVMMLAAAKGSTITVSTDGEDEIDAMEAIEKLVAACFDEGE